MGKYKIKILDTSHIFDERESGNTHTPYNFEKEFFSAVENGSRTDVKAYIEKILSEGLTVGRMSEDDLTQTKYWAVSAMTLLSRSAIRGGLDETTAYNISDNTISRMDKMKNSDDILEYIIKVCIELTDKIAENRENSVYPLSIRKCLHYINTHLHERLDAETLSAHCGISASYLSYLFKKNIGIGLSLYIRNQRLTAAKDMLIKGHSVSETAYYLGFCSESYFIKCFRQAYGRTPGKMARS